MEVCYKDKTDLRRQKGTHTDPNSKSGRKTRRSSGGEFRNERTVGEREREEENNDCVKL